MSRLGVKALFYFNLILICELVVFRSIHAGSQAVEHPKVLDLFAVFVRAQVFYKHFSERVIILVVQVRNNRLLAVVTIGYLAMGTKTKWLLVVLVVSVRGFWMFVIFNQDILLIDDTSCRNHHGICTHTIVIFEGWCYFRLYWC